VNGSDHLMEDQCYLDVGAEIDNVLSSVTESLAGECQIISADVDNKIDGTRSSKPDSSKDANRSTVPLGTICICKHLIG
jgi:hypothetical protein